MFSLTSIPPITVSVVCFLMTVKVNPINVMSAQDDHFTMEVGSQPITFENPLYATAPGVSDDPAVLHATQVLQSELTLQFANFVTN